MTVFERIIAREIPATIEYEDEEIIAIRDIAPNARVHILIVPKTPIPSLNELSAENQLLVGKVFAVAKDLALKFGIAESGYRVVTNVNADAGQTVFHMHFHLLGGEPLGPMNHQPQHSKPAPSKSSIASVLREAGIIVFAAIGLAIGFNAMNSHRIPWVKPTFEHSEASDEMLGLAEPASGVEAPPSNATPEAVLTPKTDENENSEKPTANSGIISSTPEAAVIEKQAPTFKAQPGVVLEISMAQFKRLLVGPHFLIDARTAESYGAGHIGSAVNVYGGEVESRIPELLGLVPTDRVVLIYCDGGDCELSHHVASALKQFGYGPIYIFTGGWAEWTKKQATK